MPRHFRLLAHMKPILDILAATSLILAVARIWLGFPGVLRHIRLVYSNPGFLLRFLLVIFISSIVWSYWNAYTPPPHSTGVHSNSEQADTIEGPARLSDDILFCIAAHLDRKNLFRLRGSSRPFLLAAKLRYRSEFTITNDFRGPCIEKTIASIM
jgi:hypothetical protein